jgi:hypothetical protein
VKKLAAAVVLVDVLHEFDHRVLGEVRREVAVGAHAEADGVDAVLIGAKQLVPRAGNALLDGLDEGAIARP